jgi:bacterial/archaeal transporter family-2 protein
MQTVLYLSFTFLMGVIMSIYLPMNSAVARHIGSSITANVTFFLTALVTSILILCVFGQFDTLYKIKDVPPYLYLTGSISAFIILGTTFLIPQVGARQFFILLIGGQIVMAVIVSHFGILESPKDPITAKKMIGAFLVTAGAFISTS